MSEPTILANALFNEQIRYGKEVIGFWTTLADEIGQSGVADAWVAPAKSYSEAWSKYCGSIVAARDAHWARWQQIVECDGSMQQLLSSGGFFPPNTPA